MCVREGYRLDVWLIKDACGYNLFKGGKQG